jgi:hypothetical protein
MDDTFQIGIFDKHRAEMAKVAHVQIVIPDLPPRNLLHPLGYIPAPPLQVIYADDIKTVVDE